MPYLLRPDVQLHYEVNGTGPPIVLVHGSAVDASTWSDVISPLDRDHRVVTYDRRGYGSSDHAPVRDHRKHAADLIDLLEQVAGEPATVVGWSSGGNVALAVAAARPDLLSALVVIEAPLHGLRHMNLAVLRTMFRLKSLQLRGRPVEALEEFLRLGSALKSGGNTYDRLPEDQREQLRRYHRQVLAEWDPHPFGVMHEHVPLSSVARITVPMTWLLGGESAPWIAGLHRRVARRMPGLNTVVIPGAGHLLHLERPEDFIAAVRGATGR